MRKTKILFCGLIPVLIIMVHQDALSDPEGNVDEESERLGEERERKESADEDRTMGDGAHEPGVRVESVDEESVHKKSVRKESVYREACTAKPWILVRFETKGETDPFWSSVFSDLESGLRRNGIRAEAETETKKIDPQCPPLAYLTFAMAPSMDSVVKIEIHDVITAKHVSRSIDIGGISKSGRSLGAALAAEELLRASWAELVLKTRRPVAAHPPPREVTAAVKSKLDPEMTGRRQVFHEVGLRTVFDWYSGGVMHYGGDLEYLIRIHPRFGLLLSLGGRNMVDAKSEGGEITGYAAVMSIGGALALVDPSSRFKLDAVLQAGGLWLRFYGDPVPGFAGNKVTLGGMRATAELRPAFRVSRHFHLAAHLGAGVTVLGVNLLDTGRVVDRLFGAVVSGGLAMDFRW